MGDEAACVKHAKRTGEPDFAGIELNCPERAYQKGRVGDAADIAFRTGGKPIGVELAFFAGIQAAHGAVELGFHVVGRVFRASQGGFAVVIKMRFRTVGPEDYRSAPRVGFVCFVLEFFDHGKTAGAVHDSQPAGDGIDPQLSSPVRVVHGEEAVVSDGDSGIFRGAEANVITEEV